MIEQTDIYLLQITYIGNVSFSFLQTIMTEATMTGGDSRSTTHNSHNVLAHVLKKQGQTMTKSSLE